MRQIFRSRSSRRADESQQTDTVSSNQRPVSQPQQTTSRPVSANSQQSVRRPFAGELPEHDEAAPAPNIGGNRPHTAYLPEIETGQPWYAISPPQRSPKKSPPGPLRPSRSPHNESGGMPSVQPRAEYDIPPVPDISKNETTDIDTSMPLRRVVVSSAENFDRPRAGESTRTPIADEFFATTWRRDGQNTPRLDLTAVQPSRSADGKSSETIGTITTKMPRFLNSTSSQNVASSSSQPHENIHDEAIPGPKSQRPNSGSTLLPPVPVVLSNLSHHTVEQNPPQILPISERPRSAGSASRPTSRSGIPRQSLDKPLPPPAVTRQVASGDYTEFSMRPFSRGDSSNGIAQTTKRSNLPNGMAQALRPDPADAIHSEHKPKLDIHRGVQNVYNSEQKMAVEGSKVPPSLEGIVNLQNTEHTSTYQTVAKAVVHEIVKPEVHHVREERITREIHHDHIYHRILPVIDVQVLPAKHYVKSSDAPDAEYIEVPASALPSRAWDDQRHKNWVIAETVSRLRTHGIEPGAARANFLPRQFTARTFKDGEGDFKSYERDGHPVTETTWIHPPRLEDGGRLAGQTLPLDFGKSPAPVPNEDTSAQKTAISAMDKTHA